MAVGSAFDAYVKGALAKALGMEDNTEQLLESQVETKSMIPAGKNVFNMYVASGAYEALLKELREATFIKFEFNLLNNVEDIPFNGKPDLFFISKSGMRIIYDWKVNGYMSKSVTRPKPGYIGLLEFQETPKGPYAGRNKAVTLGDYNGLKYASNFPMEDVNPEWAEQLSIYAWMAGEPIGSHEYLIGVDQICGSECQVARFRGMCSPEYQKSIWTSIQYCWKHISTGHYLPNMTFEESVKRCEELGEKDAILFRG